MEKSENLRKIEENSIRRTRIPNSSFSIENLIADRKSAPSGTVDNIESGPYFANGYNAMLSFTQLYNPWVGYLSQTANEKLSQFFTDSSKTNCHKSDSSVTNGNTSEKLLSEIMSSEQQYFVNNSYLVNSGSNAGTERFSHMEKYFWPQKGANCEVPIENHNLDNLDGAESNDSFSDDHSLTLSPPNVYTKSQGTHDFSASHYIF